MAITGVLCQSHDARPRRSVTCRALLTAEQRKKLDEFKHHHAGDELSASVAKSLGMPTMLDRSG